MKKSLAAVLLLLMLSGCATVPKVRIVHDGNDPSMLALNQVAEAAEQHSDTLARIQMAKADSSITYEGARLARLAHTAIPRGWGKRTSVAFDGPFNKLLARLATLAGYQYYTQGVRPSNLPLVSIHARHTRLKTLLDKTVAELPPTIGIALYPRTRTLIVRFKGAAL